MKNYLKLWAEDLIHRPSVIKLDSKVTVTGERNQHLGPRWEFAKVKFSVEPSEVFEVIDSVENGDLRKEPYLDWAVFGLLDILLVSRSAPIRNIRITVEDAELHSVDSSLQAFRHAGRDAGRKIIETIRKPPAKS